MFASINYNHDKRFVELPVAVAIFLVIVIAILSKHGSQPAALLLFLLVLPGCFHATLRYLGGLKLWLFMLIFPLIASLPLLVASGTGEATAAPARYVVAAICLIGLSRFRLCSSLIFRAASVGAILPLLFYLDQFSQPRADWGVGKLQSGYLAVVLLSLSLSQIFIDRHKSAWRILGIIGSLCAITLVVKTGTRGAWPAIIVVCYLHFSMIPLSAARKTACLIFGVSILVLSALFVPPVNDRIEHTAQEIKSYYNDDNHASSIGARLDLWQIAIESFAESPLWGVSYGRHNEKIKDFIERNPDIKRLKLDGKGDGRGSAHNEILDALSKRGLLGLIAILLLYFVPLRFFLFHLKNKDCDELRYVSMGAIGVIATMIICGFTEAPLMNVRVATTYGFLMVFLYHLVIRLTNPTQSHDRSPKQHENSH